MGLGGGAGVCDETQGRSVPFTQGEGITSPDTSALKGAAKSWTNPSGKEETVEMVFAKRGHKNWTCGK